MYIHFCRTCQLFRSITEQNLQLGHRESPLQLFKAIVTVAPFLLPFAPDSGCTVNQDRASSKPVRLISNF
jgi:hypothetical protein